jgi:NitT/TauT family transport system substrate-binding protein
MPPLRMASALSCRPHAEKGTTDMGAHDIRNTGRAGLTIAAALATMLLAGPAAAQNSVKFTLDWKFEGPAAPFLVPIDKGYYKAEGLDVTIDTAGGSLEPLNRATTWASATSTR